MEYIFSVAMAILQQARIDLLRLDMEGMLKVSVDLQIIGSQDFRGSKSSLISFF